MLLGINSTSKAIEIAPRAISVTLLVLLIQNSMVTRASAHAYLCIPCYRFVKAIVKDNNSFCHYSFFFPVAK